MAIGLNKSDDILSRFDKIHEHDGQTNRQHCVVNMSQFLWNKVLFSSSMSLVQSWNAVF